MIFLYLSVACLNWVFWRLYAILEVSIPFFVVLLRNHHASTKLPYFYSSGRDVHDSAVDVLVSALAGVHHIHLDAAAAAADAAHRPARAPYEPRTSGGARAVLLHCHLHRAARARLEYVHPDVHALCHGLPANHGKTAEFFAAARQYLPDAGV